MALHEVDIWNRALSRVGEARIVPGTPVVASAATANNPVVVTHTADTFSTGDLFLCRNFDEMTEINGRVFKATVLSTTTFELDDEDGSLYTAESTGGEIQKLPDLKNARACFDAWSDVRDEVLEEHPWNGVVKRNRLARKASAVTVTAATQANPVVCTAATHGYSSGDQVLLEAFDEMTEVNDRWFTITKVDDNSFSIPEDGLLYTAESTGGTSKKALTPFTPDSGYGHRYTMPTDSLRMLEIIDDDVNRLWVVEGDECLTDVGVTVPIRYIFRQKDVTEYRPALVQTLAFRLAVDLVEELTQNRKKRELALQEYQHFLEQSKRTDGQEQSPMPFVEDPWILARF